MPRRFTHDDCGDMEPSFVELKRATGRQFEILPVKETFGGLRMHVNHANDAIRHRDEAAIRESSHTGEVCGPPCKLRETVDQDFMR